MLLQELPTSWVLSEEAGLWGHPPGASPQSRDLHYRVLMY